MAEIQEEEQKLTRRERKKLRKQEKREKKVNADSQTSSLKKLGFVALVVLGAVFLWNQLQASPETSSDSNSESSTETASLNGITQNDHVAGNPEAQVVVIEYADFQCPACAAYFPITQQLKEEFGEEVAFVYRHLPLRQIHKHAQIAAQASEAAANQDKFWEFHDKLYETQDVWSKLRDPRKDFENYASDLGLDAEKFTADMNSSEAKAIVDAQYGEAIAGGLNSTPSFLINGDKISNPQGFEPFKQLIDQIISDLPETPDATESAAVSE